MGNLRTAEPVLLITALFSRHTTLLELGRAELESHFGPVGFTGLLYDFTQTTYYEKEMGKGLRKHFVAFQKLVEQDVLPSAKLLTNHMEERLAATGRFPETRPLNMDPGILTLGKFLLATTKDQAHRIYLGDRVFAEVTLRFEQGNYVPWPWTYADYRQPSVLRFMRDARIYYRDRLAARKQLWALAQPGASEVEVAQRGHDSRP
jgi:hypothetical protein